MKTMKLTTVLLTLFCVSASAFGVNPSRSVVKKAAPVRPSPLRKGEASASPLFRDPTITRGGAVPGWAAYNEALDKHPLTAKAFTSLVGWALGDLLAQVREMKGEKSRFDVQHRFRALILWAIPMIGLDR